MLKKRRLAAVLALLSAFMLAVSASAFTIDSIMLKVSVKSGDSLTKPISIFSEEGGQFNLEIIGLSGVKLSESSFSLTAGQKKTIDITFDSSNIAAGVHVGSIKVTGLGSVSYLPIIFEVESEDLFYDLNLDIPSDYSEVSKGGKVVALIKIFDLTSGGTANGLGTKSVKLEYYIYGIDGKVLSSESESVVIEGQTQITKELSIPENVASGDYVYSAIVRMGSSAGVSSQLFRVSDKKSIFEGGLSSQLFLIIGGILLFFLIMIGFFVYFIKDRDKFISEIEKYHAEELEAGRKLLHAQARAVCKRRKISAKVLEREVESKIRELRKKQEARVKELRTLKKKGDVKEMARKVKEWKAKGYRIGGLEYKLKGLTSREMSKILAKWKKQYGGKAEKPKTEEYKKK